MKIIIVDTTLAGPLIGGAQTFLPELLRGLTKKGHQVLVVSNGEPDKRVKKQLEDSGAKIEPAAWKKNALAQDAAPVFAKWVNAIRPDLYIVSVSPDIGWLTLPMLDPSITTLTIGHTDAPTFYLPAKHYAKFLTGAIGVSKQVSREYVKKAGLLDEQVEWIPYGVEANPQSPSREGSGTLQLIFVGRLEEQQKRIADLVKLVRLLSANQVNYHVDIIGDGPQQSEIVNGLEKEIKEKKVKLWGWLNKEDVLKKYRQSDVFLLTSAYEGFCIALVEAMANGCCPLVTDIESGNKDLVVDGVNGFVLPLGDTNAFAKKINELKADPGKLLHLRQEAWKTGGGYSLDRMTNAYIQFFEKMSALNKKKPRTADPGFPFMQSTISTYPLWMRRLKKTVLGK